jgi:hypothetical protein
MQSRGFGQGILHLVEEHGRQRRLLQFQIGQGKVVRDVKVGGQAQCRVELVGGGLIVPLQKINFAAQGKGAGMVRIPLQHGLRILFRFRHVPGIELGDSQIHGGIRIIRVRGHSLLKQLRRARIILPCSAKIAQMVQPNRNGLDYLFHNRGDGTFEDVSKKAGMDDPQHRFGLGAIWADYDNDGWPDLFLANDAGPNFLYHNRHDGTFDEVGMLAGVALGSDGQELGSMGVDFADYDHDGKLDLLVTNYTDQVNNLYRNLGGGAFSDMCWPAKLGQPSFRYVKWGAGFVDFDNDGWADIFVNNGHVYPQVDAIPNSPGYKEPMQMFRNNRDGTFEDISKASGVFEMPPESRRGAAFGDVYNDGNMDILVLNIGQAPSLLINKTGNSNHRVAFQLIGTKSNRAAIGARVTIHAHEVMQFNEVRSGASYLSQNDLRPHFGLGAADKIDSLEVSWPSGQTEVLRDLSADFIYTITEGKGITARVPLPPPVKPGPPASAVAESH